MRQPLRPRSLAIAMLIALLTPACAAQRYQDREAGYSLAIPSDWQFHEKPQQGSVRFGAQGPASGADGAARAQLAVAYERFPNAPELSTFAGKNLENVLAGLSSVVILSTSDDRIDGVEAKRVVYQFERDGGALTLLNYVLVHDRSGYVLSCGGRAETYRSVEADCDRVLRSFRLER